MAIRFVDKAPERAEPDGAKAARVPRVPPEAPRSAPDAVAGGEGDAGVDAPTPRLAHAKPEPKQRGRKIPMAQVAADKAKVADGTAPEAGDGLFPGLQLHAKPAPKPRGRKKAFG